MKIMILHPPKNKTKQNRTEQNGTLVRLLSPTHEQWMEMYRVLTPYLARGFLAEIVIVWCVLLIGSPLHKSKFYAGKALCCVQFNYNHVKL